MTVAESMPVRVMVQDAWDAVSLSLPPETPIVELKRQALALTRTGGDPGLFLVKHRGAELLDENRSLAEAGVAANTMLIVTPRRRRPVR